MNIEWYPVWQMILILLLSSSCRCISISVCVWHVELYRRHIVSFQSHFLLSNCNRAFRPSCLVTIGDDRLCLLDRSSGSFFQMILQQFYHCRSFSKNLKHIILTIVPRYYSVACSWSSLAMTVVLAVILYLPLKLVMWCNVTRIWGSVDVRMCC